MYWRGEIPISVEKYVHLAKQHIFMSLSLYKEKETI